MARKKQIKPTEKVPLDPNFIQMSALCYAYGLSYAQIAEYFGMTETQYTTILKDNPELKIEMLKAKSATIFELAQELVQKARAGSVQSMIFYLKATAGFREVTTAVVDSSKAVNFTINTNDPVEAARIYQKIMGGG